MARRFTLSEPDEPDDGAPRGSILRPGERVDDRFVVEAKLAAGTMGAVYRAADVKSGARVALKVQHASASASDRLAREGEALSRLDHPGIVKYVGHGQTAMGAPYIAMELVEADTLAERVGRPLALPQVVAVGRQLADALAAVHALGIVHRDVKPSNVAVVGESSDGMLQIKLLDFGLNRDLSADTRDQPGRQHTPPGALVGTPDYMSPEQVAGRKEIDARADVFSLGVILHECLTGTHPFAAADVLAVLSKIIYQEAPPILTAAPDAPAPLARLVTNMLSKSPDGRPRDGAAVAAALRALGPIRMQRPASARPVVSEKELRILSVIVAGQADADGSDADDNAQTKLGQIATNFGAEITYLLDGSIVATISGEGDAAERAGVAARCALSMRQALPRAPLSLATGRAAMAGRVPDGEAIDRAVLLARAAAHERRRPHAGASPVRIDATTASLLDERFEHNADGSVFRLMRERDAIAPPRMLLGKHTPFVGRDDELEALREAFVQCALHRRPAIAVVEGPAGSGKSRLAHELVRELDRAHRASIPEEAAVLNPVLQGFENWLGRGDPSKPNAPFHLLAQLVRDGVGLDRSEGLLGRRERLRERLSRCGDWEDVERIAEFLGEVAGTQFTRKHSVQLRAADRDPILMGDQIRRAFEDWVLAESQRRPVLIVVDDLHWGDTASMQALENVLSVGTDRPIFLLLLGRAEMRSRFPHLCLPKPIASEKNLASGATAPEDNEHGNGALTTHDVSLSPLSPHAIEALVRSVLGQTARAETVHDIIESAAGIPLYAEELIRAAAHQAKPGRAGAVVAMMQARLEALPATARRILRAASIFGGTFSEGAALALLGDALTHAELTTELSELISTEVLVRHQPLRTAEDREYAFCHAMLQEAAYESLPSEERSRAHARAAVWLPAHGESDARVIAMHHERAGDPRSASNFYAQAAEQALEGGDFEAVGDCARRAIDCGASAEVVAGLELLQAEASRGQGDTRSVLDHAQAALDALPPGHPLVHHAAVERVIARSRLGDRAGLLEVAEQLQRALLTETIDRDLLLSASQMASHLIVMGDATAAKQLVARIEMTARPMSAGDPSVEARLELVRAWQAAFNGEAGARLSHMLRAVSCLDRAGDARTGCRERVNLAAAYIELGMYEKAEAETRLALSTASRMGLEAAVAFAQRYLGLALFGLGDEEEARSSVEQALTVFRAKGNRRMETAAACTLARLLLAQRLVGPAENVARNAMETGASPADACIAEATLSAAHLAKGERKQALVLAASAAQRMSEIGGIDEGEAFILLNHAQALHASGDPVGAKVAILAAQQRLIGRAARINDADWQRSFLSEQLDHAATMRLARDWCGTEDEPTMP